MLRHEDLTIDLVYADLNIAYLKNGLLSKRTSIVSDKKNNKDYILTSSFWPKNNSIGLRKWIDHYSSWVEFYLSKEGLPDIIHAHTYLGAMVAEKVKKKNKIPYIVSEHFTGWLDDSIRTLHKHLGVRALGGAEKVVAVSDQLANQLKSQVSRDVDTIPNFIDTQLFQPLNRKSKNSKKIIYVGDLIERKQVALIIKAMTFLEKKYTLTIIGEGPLLKHLNKMVVAEGLKDRIIFTGRLLKEEVAFQLQSHDILVHPSKLESFGLTVVESLCCGVPVVSFENRGVEMMKNLKGLHICKEQTPKGLVATIKGLLDENSVDYKIKISADARARYSPSVYKKKISNIYENIID